MSIFDSILSKLGLGKDDEQAVAYDSTESKASIETPDPVQVSGAEATPTPISQVDVVAKLTAMADSNSQKLNWKTSIVDLMKLLGLDSSYSVRKELAVELGCPAEKMGDSAQMNMWLHKTVLQKLAENGGNIPAELLD